MMTHHDPLPPFAQASLFISACAGWASREPIQSVAAAELMVWLHFRLMCGCVYNWKVCRANGFCLTNAELGDICPSACRWCWSKTWNEGNNSARCWCPSVTLINSLSPSIALKSKRETVRNDFFVIQIWQEWNWAFITKEGFAQFSQIMHNLTLGVW